MIIKYNKSSDPSCGDINGWIAKIKWQWNENTSEDLIPDPNCNGANSPKPADLVLPPLPPGCWYEATYIGGVIATFDRNTLDYKQVEQWDSSLSCEPRVPIYDSRRRTWSMGVQASKCPILGYQGNGTGSFSFGLETDIPAQRTPGYQLYKITSTNVNTDYHVRARQELSASRRFNTNIIKPGIAYGNNISGIQICNSTGTRPNPNTLFNIVGGCISLFRVDIPVHQVYLFCPGEVPSLAYQNPDPCANKKPDEDGDSNSLEQNIVLDDKNRSSFWRVNINTLTNGTLNRALTPPRPNSSLSVQFVFCGCSVCEKSCGNCCVDCVSIAEDIKNKFGLNNNNDPGSGG